MIQYGSRLNSPLYRSTCIQMHYIPQAIEMKNLILQVLAVRLNSRVTDVRPP